MDGLDSIYRGPYSSFLRVASRASKPDGILAWLFAMGCLDESAELYKRTVKKLCAT